MGFSVTDNPIPDEHMNSLFPAIIEKHLHMGGSYDINDNSTITFAYSHALESSQTNSNPLTGNVHVDHDQDSWQLCYDYRF